MSKNHYIKGIILFAVSCIYIVLIMKIPILEWTIPCIITIVIFTLIMAGVFDLRDELSCALKINKKH